MPDFEEMLVKIRGDVSDLIKAYAEGEAASKGFKDSVGKDSKATSENFKGVGKDADAMSKTIARAMKDGQTTVQSFQSRSADLRGEIVKLKQEFLRTGDASTFQGIKSAEGDLKRLTSAAKDLGIELEHVEKVVGPSFGRKILSTVQNSIFSEFNGLGSLLTNPVALGGLAIVGTVLSSVVAAGIAAGVGLGFAGIGVYVQRNSPRVVAAFASLKTSIGAILKDSTSNLVDPIVEALNSFRDFATTEGPLLKSIFAPLGSIITTAGQDLQRLLAAIGPSLQRVGETFASVFSNPNVQRSLAGIANSLRSLFDTIGSHPREVEEGFVLISEGAQLVLNVLSGLIVVDAKLNDVIQAFVDLVHGHFGQALRDLKGDSEQATFGIGQFGDVVNGVAVPVAGADNVVRSLGTNVKNLADAINNQLNTAFDNAINKALALSGSEVGVKQALADLTKSLDQNGKSFDLNTQKGRNNQNQLNSSIGALLSHYDAMIADNKGVAASSLAYQLQLDKIKASLAAKGLDSQAIAKLTRQYELLPAQKTTVIKALGTSAARLGVLGVMGAINHLHGKTVGINVKVFGEAAALAAAAAIKGALGKANSGVVTAGRNTFANSGIAIPHFDMSGIYPGVPGGMYRFAEPSTREEALIARNGDSGRALASLGTAASWFGGTVVIDRGSGQGRGIQYATAGSGGGGYASYPLYATIEIDGKAAVRALTSAAQKRGHRNGGVTGLG